MDSIYIQICTTKFTLISVFLHFVSKYVLVSTSIYKVSFKLTFWKAPQTMNHPAQTKLSSAYKQTKITYYKRFTTKSWYLQQWSLSTELDWQSWQETMEYMSTGNVVSHGPVCVHSWQHKYIYMDINKVHSNKLHHIFQLKNSIWDLLSAPLPLPDECS